MKTMFAVLVFSAFVGMPAKQAHGPTTPISTEQDRKAGYPDPRHGGPMTTGPSGALDCVDFGPGVCDVLTAVVPLKANANTITGMWTFEQMRIAVYAVKNLPRCGAGFEGQMAGVKDATEAVYNATPQGGGKLHVPVYCNGTAWVMH